MDQCVVTGLSLIGPFTVLNFICTFSAVFTAIHVHKILCNNRTDLSGDESDLSEDKSDNSESEEDINDADLIASVRNSPTDTLRDVVQEASNILNQSNNLPENRKEALESLVKVISPFLNEQIERLPEEKYQQIYNSILKEIPDIITKLNNVDPPKLTGEQEGKYLMQTLESLK